MGLRSVAKDLGLSWKLTVLTDATAAIGVCKRRGLGKIRHLATADLWIQDKLRCKEFELIKVAGKDNIADALTKHTDRATLEKTHACDGPSCWIWPSTDSTDTESKCIRPPS